MALCRFDPFRSVSLYYHKIEISANQTIEFQLIRHTRNIHNAHTLTHANSSHNSQVNAYSSCSLHSISHWHCGYFTSFILNSFFVIDFGILNSIIIYRNTLSTKSCWPQQHSICMSVKSLSIPTTSGTQRKFAFCSHFIWFESTLLAYEKRRVKKMTE